MKQKLVLGCALISLATGCASFNADKTTAPPDGQAVQTADSENAIATDEKKAAKAVRAAGRFVVMRAVDTPVKVAAGIGRAAAAVKKKIDEEEVPAETN